MFCCTFHSEWKAEKIRNSISGGIKGKNRTTVISQEHYMHDILQQNIPPPVFNLIISSRSLFIADNWQKCQRRQVMQSRPVAGPLLVMRYRSFFLIPNPISFHLLLYSFWYFKVAASRGGFITLKLSVIYKLITTLSKLLNILAHFGLSSQLIPETIFSFFYWWLIS